jgi:aarF domain-containing kinase
VLESKSIFDIEGIQLMIGMLNIIRQNNMKLDGEFATLLTNIVVLESIAKEIDPSIQILKLAVPYFKFADNPAKSIDHEPLNSILA